MHQVDNETTTPEMPPFEMTIRPGWFTKGGQGQAATYPGADWFNMVQAELLNVLGAAGILPDKPQLDQLAQAVVKLATETAANTVSGVFLEKAKNLADVPDKAKARTALDVLASAVVHQLVSDALTAMTQALAQHANAADPHSQYTTAQELSTALSQAITAHKNESDPHSQYIGNAQLTEAIEAHKKANNAHPAKSVTTGITGVPGSNLEETLQALVENATSNELQTTFFTVTGSVAAYTCSADRPLSKLLAAGKLVEIQVIAGWSNRGRLCTTTWLVDGANPATYYEENVNCATVLVKQQADNSVQFTTDQRIFAIYHRLIK
ncbi:hypothetical protein [Shewanella algae]|uniref:hypothetical protein n=1 Tax=Shewanella algae TaxID=38313 RepID=UPI0031F5308C